MPPTLHGCLKDRLLENWQRELPLTGRPFAAMAVHEGASEAMVLQTLTSLQTEGVISRVGGVVRPNTLGASTLAALAAPDLQTSSIAALIGAEPGVNHVYLRENDWNLWFVVTGPDRTYVDGVLKRIESETGLRVLDLRLERPYHIDLGFKLNGSSGAKRGLPRTPGLVFPLYEPAAMDRILVQVLTGGLPLIPEPFAPVADHLNCSQEQVIERLKILVATGIVPRIGVIVRHRALGWRSNAMVVWDVEEEQIEAAGQLLAAAPAINLCYRRRRYEQEWPYNLYCMVHARSRQEALDRMLQAETLAGLTGRPRQVLFSLRCFKQTGALLTFPKEAA